MQPQTVVSILFRFIRYFQALRKPIPEPDGVEESLRFARRELAILLETTEGVAEYELRALEFGTEVVQERILLQRSKRAGTIRELRWKIEDLRRKTDR